MFRFIRNPICCPIPPELLRRTSFLCFVSRMVLRTKSLSLVPVESAPQVGSWSRLLLARVSSLQLPWLRRWNLTGDIRRYHYLKPCLISSSDLHVKLNVIRFSFRDAQYPVRSMASTIASLPS